MSERPILFSSPMVRAILEGRKTQTRRAVKPQPPFGCAYTINGAGSDALCYALANEARGPKGETIWVPPTPTSQDHRLPCPYGRPGDRLWVRETWRYFGGQEYEYQQHRPSVVYRATHESLEGAGSGWRPSIHMPRWASRITLEIESVRVERLQEISEADAKAEGATEAIMGLDGPAYDRAEKAWCRATGADDPDAGAATARGAFFVLWDTINGKSHPWKSNPWVWAITFRRIEPSLA